MIVVPVPVGNGVLPFPSIYNSPLFTVYCKLGIAESHYQSLKGGSVLISEMYITQVCMGIEGE